jgi:poly(A) polymerase
MKLENVPSVALVHPFVDGFKKTYVCHSREDIYTAIHGKELPERPVNAAHSRMIWTKTFYIGLFIRVGSGKVILRIVVNSRKC